jgi:hypothetical protein
MESSTAGTYLKTLSSLVGSKLLYQLVGSQSQREILARTLDFNNNNPMNQGDTLLAQYIIRVTNCSPDGAWISKYS